VTAALDSAALQHVLRQIGLDAESVATLDALGAALNAQSPEALRAARGESTLSSATSPFFLPLLPAAMSEPQRALVNALALGALGRESLERLLADWAASLNPEEPTERAQRDCLPLQALLRSGALRVYAGDAARCEAALAAAERLGMAQLALIAEVAARGTRARAAGNTGLAAFMAQLAASLEARRADGRPLALLFVDCGIVARIDNVWGYGVGVDLTRRDRQAEAKKAGTPWDTAKGFDLSAPISALTPAAQAGDVRNARIWLKVNGETRQDSNTSGMIWSVPEIIAGLSSRWAP